MGRFLVAVVAASLAWSGSARGQAKAPAGPERSSVEFALKEHEREVASARKEFDAVVSKATREFEAAAAKADRKLSGAYDSAIGSAMKRGSAGLEFANGLVDEKKKLVGGGAGTAASRDKFVQNLTAKTWYWHWENKIRDIPFQHAPGGAIVKRSGSDFGSKWVIEPRWVVRTGDHYLIQLTDDTFRGFYIPTGRPVGMFADPAKK